MFVNLNKNKSGTTSVRVLEKRGRKNVLIKSLGSSEEETEIERILKLAGSSITIERARELVKTMYALTYHKAGYIKPHKVMLRMDEEQAELYMLVKKWVEAK